MTVRSARLDLTLSAHLMSDGSGSHCRMMSESPREFNIFTARIVRTCASNVFQHDMVCITGSSLSSMMRSVRLCGSACALPLTHDVQHG